MKNKIVSKEKCENQCQRQTVRSQADGGKKTEQDYAEVCSEHVNLSMGKIDQFKDSVDH